MSWGFNDDNSLKEFINKVLAKDPSRDSNTTPAWMSGLNILYKEHPNVDSKYRDGLLKDDIDINKYNPLLEYMLEYNPKELLTNSLYTHEYKGIPIDDSVYERARAMYKDTTQQEKDKENEDLEGYKKYLYNYMWKKYADKNEEFLSKASPSQIGNLMYAMKLKARKLAEQTPRYFGFLDDIDYEDYSPSLDRAYTLHKKWSDYKDEQARNRGIKYPQLRFNSGDYLEDYLVDEYGNKIENAFDNNIGWFRDKLGPELKEGSALEYKLKDVLSQNRANLMQSNILKALAPDEEGGIF